MGQFDGMLLVSDYDNTLRYTAVALERGQEAPPVSQRNIDAINRWIGGGGRFALATGRALPAIRKCVDGIPTNAPAIVDNGGAIYDLNENRYLLKRFLPEAAVGHITAVMESFPELSLELYYADDRVQVMRPTDWNRRHAGLTGLAYEEIESLASTEPPLAKALFLSEPEVLKKVPPFMEEKGWAWEYELIFSNRNLLELTARGANKGAMALKLKELCGCGKLYCAGDHLNDIPMLDAADRAFCPANSVPEVLSCGATVVCHCVDGAVAEAIEILERDMPQCGEGM